VTLIGGTLVYISQKDTDNAIEWIDGIFWAASAVGQDGIPL